MKKVSPVNNYIAESTSFTTLRSGMASSTELSILGGGFGCCARKKESKANDKTPNIQMCMYIHIYIYTYIYIFICLFIYRERESERDTATYNIYIYILYIHTHTHVQTCPSPLPLPYKQGCAILHESSMTSSNEHHPCDCLLVRGLAWLPWRYSNNIHQDPKHTTNIP